MTEKYGRYLDIDDDGITYRTFPGSHPEKGATVTRGTSRDEYAVYTEDGDAYVRNMERLSKKFETAKQYVPAPKIKPAGKATPYGMIFFGTTASPGYEATEILEEEGILLDTMRLRAFPFNEEVDQFVAEHEIVFVVEQNRDGQMRRLLINECELQPKKLVSVLHFDGLPITARGIVNAMRESLGGDNVTSIRPAETSRSKESKK